MVNTAKPHAGTRHCSAIRRPAWVALAFTLMIPAASADSFTGRVVEVADGDTLTLLVGRQHHKIKIAAIDAPERYQAWGDQARTNLSRLALSQTAVADCPRLDHRSALYICKLTVDTLDIGIEQIKDGMAWWFRGDAHQQSTEAQSAYGSAELLAKLRRQGLWRDTNPVPPWNFRGER